MEILGHFQCKVLSMIVETPWYVPNTVIRGCQQLRKKSTATFLSTVIVLVYTQADNNRRLRKQLPNDHPTRFLVYISYLQLESLRFSLYDSSP
jgi:hypothetical protein